MSNPLIGTLQTVPAKERPDLLAEPVWAALSARPEAEVYVAEIDPTLADTAQFCAAYGVPLRSPPTVSWLQAGGLASSGWPRAWCSPRRGPTSTTS